MISNRTVTPTIYVGTPNTYRAWLTPDGWTVIFLVSRTEYRTVDGGKMYKHRNNATRRAAHLNHPIRYKIKKTGVCEAYHDGHTLSVREDENEQMEDTYVLSIQDSGMPPYFHKEFKTTDEVEQYILNETAYPLYLDWKPVKENE